MHTQRIFLWEATHNRFYRVHREPTLARILVAPLILARSMQDRDADGSIGVNVGMPHGSDKLHLGREKRVFWGEYQLGLEEAAFVECVVGADDHDLPFEQVALILETCAEPIDGSLAKLGELSLEQERVSRGRRSHCLDCCLSYGATKCEDGEGKSATDPGVTGKAGSCCRSVVGARA